MTQSRVKSAHLDTRNIRSPNLWSFWVSKRFQAKAQREV